MSIILKKLPTQSAQILLSTLLVLLIIALTIVTITITINRNALQVGANLDYDKNYNIAESRILSTIKRIASEGGDLNLANINSLLGTDGDCVLDDPPTNAFGNVLICSFLETDGSRTALRISKENSVYNYSLANEEYFDVILTGATTNVVNINWIGDQPAFDLALLYTNGSDIKEIHHTMNGTGVNTNIFTKVDTRTNIAEVTGSENKLQVSLDKFAAPSGSVYKTLRVKILTKLTNSSLDIYADDSTGLPAQVIKMEALSYDTKVGKNSSPNIITLIPLSPQVPMDLIYGMNFQSFHSPICGDGVIEGGEQCEGPACVCSVYITNSSFEFPQIPAGDPWVRRTSIDGWTGEFDQHQDLTVHEGHQNVDLNTDHPGYIQQTITTTPGRQYTLSYWSAINNMCDANATYTVELLVNGVSQGTQVSNNVYQQKTINFVASTTSTVIRLQSLSGTNCGPSVDDITIKCSSSDCKCPIDNQAIKSTWTIDEVPQAPWSSTPVNPQAIDLTMNPTDDDHCPFWKNNYPNYAGGYEDFKTKIWQVSMCYGTARYLEWYPVNGAGPTMDDLLVLYSADDTISFDASTNTYTLPVNHIIIGPTGGVLNGDIKTMKVAGHSDGYTFGGDGSQVGNIADFTEAKGFHTSKFECPIPIQTLINNGLIKVGGNGIVDLKFEHIPSGCGHVMAQLRTSTTVTRPPNPIYGCVY